MKRHPVLPKPDLTPHQVVAEEKTSWIAPFGRQAVRGRHLIPAGGHGARTAASMVDTVFDEINASYTGPVTVTQDPDDLQRHQGRGHRPPGQGQRCPTTGAGAFTDQPRARSTTGPSSMVDRSTTRPLTPHPLIMLSRTPADSASCAQIARSAALDEVRPEVGLTLNSAARRAFFQDLSVTYCDGSPGPHRDAVERLVDEHRPHLRAICGSRASTCGIRAA
jgi:hypothetical protein